MNKTFWWRKSRQILSTTWLIRLRDESLFSKTPAETHYVLCHSQRPPRRSWCNLMGCRVQGAPRRRTPPRSISVDDIDCFDATMDHKLALYLSTILFYCLHYQTGYWITSYSYQTNSLNKSTLIELWAVLIGLVPTNLNLNNTPCIINLIKFPKKKTFFFFW